MTTQSEAHCGADFTKVNPLCHDAVICALLHCGSTVTNIRHVSELVAATKDLSLWHQPRHTITYLDGKCRYIDIFLRHAELDNGCAGIEGTRLVEDEIADAVEDGAASVGLRGLKRVAVVANQGVGTGIDKSVRLHTLGRDGLDSMLGSPVQADDDSATWVPAFQTLDGRTERIDGLLADTGTVRQIGKVLECHLHGGKEEDLAWRAGQKDGLDGFVHCLTCTDRHHARPTDVVDGRDESLAPLIDAVIVGEVQVGDAMTMQDWQPRRLASEAETLEDRRLHLGGRAFEIGNDDVGCCKKAVNLPCKKQINSL